MELDYRYQSENHILSVLTVKTNTGYVFLLLLLLILLLILFLHFVQSYSKKIIPPLSPSSVSNVEKLFDLIRRITFTGIAPNIPPSSGRSSP
jgi:hypothetical protein